MPLKEIVVITVGTRDLAFRLEDENWLNIGNDRSSDLDSISQQVQVQADLGINEKSFRAITEYIDSNWEIYKDRVIPIITGALLEKRKSDIEKVYIVGTDQEKDVSYREKDTIFAAQILGKFIENKYKIPTSISSQGKQGQNPANFEQMFAWWKNFWSHISPEVDEYTNIILCLKGGVNQSSEAARISVLSRFGESASFYDFIENEAKNQTGMPSEYTIPFKGTNYLWDRKQKEILSLLDRWDFNGAYELFKPYLKDNCNPQNLRIEKALELGIIWNRADFQGFANKIDNEFKNQTKYFWWSPYEAAYLGIVRFYQGNTIEAFFHTFRAVEGLTIQWARNRYKSPYCTERYPNSYSLTIAACNSFAELGNLRSEFDNGYLDFYGRKLDLLVGANYAKLNSIFFPDWQVFSTITRNWRNRTFHQILKLEEKQLFEAWKTTSSREWQKRVIRCLNYLSDQTFTCLEKVSLITKVKDGLTTDIAKYNPN